MNRAWYFFFAVALFLFSSCANQVTPEGGDKDLKPPKVMKSSPENFSTHFDSKKIEITFDEYIQLKDLNGQLIVSPPLSRMPETKLKQKTLVVEWDDTLQPNTTYTLNFGNSIVDNNEGNVLEDFQYVFSTGDVIDSLKISGKVENAKDKKTEKGILVMLYKINDDSLPLKSRPDYFGKTNEKGEFKISNIAQASYKIFALKESNADYLFNTPEESVAFREAPVPSNTSIVLLDLFQENPKQYLVKNFSEEPGKAVFIFSQPAANVNYRFVRDSVKFDLAAVEQSTKKDTLIFWYKNRNLDSLVLFFSDDAKMKDTVTVRLFKAEGKMFSRMKSGLSIGANINSGELFDLNKYIGVQFNHPVTEFDFPKIRLKEDSATLNNLSIAFTDSVRRNFYIKHVWKEKTAYQLFIPPGTFTDIFGLKNDTFLITFKTHQLTDYGTLALKVKPADESKQYVVMLIDDKDNVYRTSIVHSETTLNYDYLEPKIYRLKVVEDKNRNGEWDTGNYLRKIHAEKVSYYPEPITVRANWDVEVSWKLDVGN